jgi:pyruvate,water dikinase
MYAYNGALAGGLRRSGIDPDRVDMAGDGPPGGERDLSAHLAELNRRFRSLSESEQAALLAGESDPRQPDDGGLAAKVAQFLDRFGHLSESGNDFSQPPWREQPELVWRMIAGYDAPASGEAKLRWAEVPLSPARRAGLGMLYRKARTFRTYREKVGDAYTYGYGLFRPIFRELGRRLVERDLLAAADDIFYMTWDEIRTLVAGSGLEAAPAALVSRRKGEMIEASRYHLPDIIYGEEPPPPETVGGSRDRLTGIPTARGYYRGPVRVVLTPGDFVRVEAGDAVAIPYSDVSWTPLIARAGAVISESGGTLSHSAIVAREYGLPAVLSVEGACRLLRDGMIVTVDGYRGEVIVHEDEPQGGTSG